MERNKNKLPRKAGKGIQHESTQQGYLEDDYGDRPQQEQQSPEDRNMNAEHEPRKQRGAGNRNKTGRS